MAQRKAMVRAGDTRSLMVLRSNSGILGFGRLIPLPSSGNFEPMVANSMPAKRLSSREAAVPTIMAMSAPGTFLVTYLFHSMMVSRQTALRAVSTQSMLPRLLK